MLPLFLSQLLEWSIYYLNKIINTIASLEQFIIQDIPLHFYLLITGYLVVFTIIIWFKKPTFTKLALATASLLMMQISYFTIYYNALHEEELIVFNSKKSTLIAERRSNAITIYATDSILKMSDKNTILKSYAIGNLSSVTRKIKLENYIYFNGKRVYIIDSSAIYPINVKPDILILTQSSKVNLDRVLQNMKPSLVIADASNFKTIQKNWKASCIKYKIPFHATAEKGFYKLN